MKCHVTDAECGTDANAEFAGRLTDDAHRLTQTVIDLLDLEMQLADERLASDNIIDGKRVIVWYWLGPNLFPIKFEFTE